MIKVANCGVTASAADPRSRRWRQSAQVTVTGMYPSYHCKVDFDVTSTGSVPVHVRLPEPTAISPNGLPPISKPAMTMENNCTRVSTGYCTIDIHFTNDQALPKAPGPYTFGWTILATQWNEDPTSLNIQIRSYWNLCWPLRDGLAGLARRTHPYVVNGGHTIDFSPWPISDVGTRGLLVWNQCKLPV